MADADVATQPTPATEDVTPVDAVETPSQSAAVADPLPPTVNGVAEPVTAAVPPVEEAAPLAGTPRVDVTEDAEKMTTKYELYDKDAEIADKVAAALKSARLQVSLKYYCRKS